MSIASVLTDWQEKLLQLDRRNRLLYFKPPTSRSRSIVPFGDAHPDALVETLSSRRSGLKFPLLVRSSEPDPAVVPGDIEIPLSPVQLDGTLANLRRRDREFTEEQGLNVLFVAAGFLEWVDEDGVQGLAPLVLLPCNLERASPRDHYYLVREDEDPAGNATLAFKLKQLGITLPPYEHDPDEALDSYFQRVQQAVAKAGWAVRREAYLGIFQFSKLAMWEDLETLKGGQAAEHPLVSTLAGVPTGYATASAAPGGEWFELSERELAGARLDEHVDPRQFPLVVDADYSQLQAIGAAFSDSNVVVHGPPGTGKSQTITNIIAMAMWQGKSVLFVSEKTTALDIVKRNLDRVGLGRFCLDLHSDRAAKARVYQQLDETLKAPRSLPPRRYSYDDLLTCRQRLNEVVRELHARRMPLDYSAYQVQGKLARVVQAPQAAFSIPHPSALTHHQLSAWTAAAAELSEFTQEFAEHFTSPWNTLKLRSTPFRLADQIETALRPFLEATTWLLDVSQRLGEFLDAPAPSSAAHLRSAMGLLARLENAEPIPAVWLDDAARGRLRVLAGQLSEAEQAYRAQLDVIRPIFGPDPPALDYRALRSSLASHPINPELATTLLGAEWQARVTNAPNDLAQRCEALAQTIESLLEAAREAAEGLDQPPPAAWKDAPPLMHLVQGVAAVAPVASTWLDPDEQVEHRVYALVKDGEALSSELNAAETALFESWSNAVVDVVDREMLARFRGSYANPLKRMFSREYRRDRDALVACHRSAVSLSFAAALEAVDAAARVRELRARWNAYVDRAGADLAPGFDGRATDWSSLRTRFSRCRELLPTLRSNSARKWLLDGEGAETARAVSSRLAEAAQRREQLEDQLECQPPLPENPIANRAMNARRLVEPLTRVQAIMGQIEPHLVRGFTGYEELGQLLESTHKLVELDEDFRDRSDDLAKDFGSWFQGHDTRWEDVLHQLNLTGETVAMVPGRGPRFGKHLTSPGDPAEYRQRRFEVDKRLQDFTVASQQLSELFSPPSNATDWEEIEFENLHSWTTHLIDSRGQATRWNQYRQAAERLDVLVGIPVVSPIREATVDVLQVRDVFIRRVCECWLEDLYERVPTLGRFTREGHESVLSAFRELDSESPVATRAEVANRVLERYPNTAGTVTNVGEMATLNKEINKKRKQLPVRRLLRRIPTLARRLKPCFLMSPLAVSQYLERSEIASENLEFELVIFDEASQIFPEDAIPAISRGKFSIVVGDEKQLPPTSYFRKLVDGDDDGAADDDDDADQNALDDTESILKVMLGQSGAAARERWLSVHYRSRHQDLIRFSNHMYYEDRLIVFPSPWVDEPGLGLRRVYLPDGRYDSGASRTNQVEAERSVDLVFELMRSVPKDESIGVVTLSRAQADHIISMLELRRQVETDVDERFREDVEEPFFVKNLENVQGDERDHMIMSTGYGPSVATGHVANRFGPLNGDVGVRRLNVAVSRARRSMTVITSMRSADIHAPSLGAQHLRRYLEFLENPRTAFVATQTVDPDAETESEFEEAVKRALEYRGHRVQPQVGVAGFRIDLGVYSEGGRRFDLGIECDGATYHSTPAARDRDAIRQSILEGLGWTIHRIWSTSWIRDPASELDRVEAALRRARTAQDPQHAATAPRSAPAATSTTLGPSSPPVAQVSLPLHSGGPQSSLLFEPYVQARVTPASRWESLATASPASLTKRILEVLQAEGPVHFEVIVARLRGAYRQGRAGGPARDNARSALHSLLRSNEAGQIEPDIFALPGNEARPRRSDDGARKIEHISVAERCAALLAVCEDALSARRNELVVETARQFGYSRTGSDIRAALETALDTLIEEAKIQQDNGGSVRPV